MLKKLLTTLFLTLLLVTQVQAQTWSHGSNMAVGNWNEDVYCPCNPGWSWAQAVGTNCTYWAGQGCWNPNYQGGSCWPCGENGTVAIGDWACFEGQSSGPGHSGGNTFAGMMCGPQISSGGQPQ